MGQFNAFLFELYPANLDYISHQGYLQAFFIKKKKNIAFHVLTKMFFFCRIKTNKIKLEEIK